jgi:hypothetical protein
VANFSNWFANQLLGVLEGEIPHVPSQLYVAVNGTNSTPGNPGTEITGAGYARREIVFARVSDIKRWNTVDILSPAVAEGTWEIRSFSLHDALTGGNYYAFGNLSSPLSLEVGKSVLWPASSVIIAFGS